MPVFCDIITSMEEIEYPIRINRYLFLKNYCSRRQADLMIKQSLVRINGKVAILGQKVEKTDDVQVANRLKKLKESFQYVLFNKPRGVVSHNPQEGEQSVEDVYKSKVRLSPIGRLDKDSNGLMILTNDGRIIDKLLNPKYDHEKEYNVRVDKDLKPSFQTKMERGVDIEGYVTKPCKVKATGAKTFSIILTEGKKHQIRRMTASLGYQVKKLKRVRFGPIRLFGVEEGEGRPLYTDEKFALLKLAGINDDK